MRSARERWRSTRALIAGGPGEQEDGHRRAGRRRGAVARRPVMVAALVAGLLAVPAFTMAAAASPGQAGAPPGATAVRDIPGCVEEQRATRTNGSPAPWEACTSRTGIQGIEGSNAVNSKGTIFQGSAIPDSNGHTALARSRDGGTSWERVPLPIEFSDVIGYVQVDPTTDRLFFMSIARVFEPTSPGFGFTNPIGYSDDDGATWHVTRLAGANPGLNIGDLGSIFIGPPPAGTQTSGYPNVIYTCNLSPQPSSPTSDMQCWRSLDGGNTFQRPSTPTFPRATADCPAVVGPSDVLIPNRGVVAPDGTVYLPMSECGKWVVGVSKDAGQTFTWAPVTGARNDIDQAVLADQVANVPGCANSVAFAGCPEVFQLYGQQRLALDAKGTLYFIHNDDGLKLSVSSDGGRSWTQPTIVSAPGVLAVFSSIVARGNGEVGLSYLGRPAGSKDWNGYMAVVEHADKPNARNIQTALVNAPNDPLMPNRCCGSNDIIVPPGTPHPAVDYNLFEHGGLSYAPDGTLWAALFRDSTRDPNNTQSAAYEIVEGHMAPIGGGSHG